MSNTYSILCCNSRLDGDFVNELDSSKANLSDIYCISAHMTATEDDSLAAGRSLRADIQPIMTNRLVKTNRRLGILKAKVDVKVQGNYKPWLAIIDSAAARSVVERGSPLLLTGRARKKAMERLYFLEDSALYKAVQRKEPAYVRTLHGQRKLTKQELGVISVRINDAELNLLVIVAEPNTLSDAQLILDADALQKARVDVTGLFKRREAHPEATLTLSKIEKKKNGKCSPSETLPNAEDPLEAWCGYVEEGEYISPDDETSFMTLMTPDLKRRRAEFEVDVLLSEIKCKTVLLNGGDPFKTKEFSLDMVKIAGDAHLSKDHQKVLRDLVKEFEDIFVGSNALPPVMKNKAPAKLLMREGAEQVSCPIPRWGPYQEKILRMWAEKALKDGLVEMADEDCPYASRPHLVPKPELAIRVTGDYQRLNEAIVKRPMNLPNMEDQLRRHLGAKYFTLADAAQGYFQLLMDKASRQRCALWTPIGKVVPTRLPMGVKNAGVLYQEAVSQALGTMPEKTKERMSNYLDDHLTSGRTFEEYLENTKNFFQACREHGISLNPAKTKLGFPTAKILGREVSENKIIVHDDNLQSLRDCPSRLNDAHEVKRVLGICEFARKHVKDFATLAKPLQNLTRKNVPWNWTSEVEDSFEKLKTAVLANIQLHVPDDSKPLYLFTDASDYGMGAQLCQLRHPVKDEDLKYVKESDKLPIAFYSASFDEAMQRRPIYYREARALIWGLEKTREFTERNPHEVVVVTDHAPLQWIKHATKGPVTGWLIETVADIEYRVVYMLGKANTTADALSRPPMVSPTRFNLAGAEEIWDALLRLLPDIDMNAPKVSVWAAQHTGSIQRRVQAWRKPRNPINVHAPKSMLKHVKDFDLILSAPAPEEAPIVAHHILKEMLEHKSTATFACLIPSDLIVYIPSGGNESGVDKRIRAEICAKLRNECIKQTHTAIGFTWLVFNAKSEIKDKVYTTEKLTGKEFLFQFDVEEKSEDEQKPLADILTYGNVNASELSTWIEEQSAELDDINKHYPKQWVKRPDGLIMVTTETGNMIYVPTGQRRNLVMKVHREMVHGMIRRVRRVLTSKYRWPKMISNMLTWIAECSECPLKKAKMNIAHNLYSPTDWRKPRTAYGVDFYSIATSRRGHVGVLTVTDLFTRFVMFIPVKDKTAETFAQVLMERVVFQRGAFKHLVSDGAQAFVGKTASNLAEMLKIKKVETYYYPQGNSTTERNHILLGEFLRLLPEDRRPDWDLEVGAVAYAQNMCVNSSTGFSPFELDCGFQPSSTADLIFQGKPLPVFETEMFAKTPEEQMQLMQRIKDMHKIAQETDKLSKEITIQRLNNQNSKALDYIPGEKVLMYVRASPAKSGEANSPWKSKHLTHWRRGTVMKKLSSSTYEVIDTKGQTFIRSVALMKKDTSKTDAISEVEESQDANSIADIISEEKFYQIGTMLAIREDNNPDNKEFVIVETLKTLESGNLMVRYYGTTSKNTDKAKFSLVWVDNKDRILLRNDKPSGHKAMTALIDPELILGEIKLNADQTLSRESLTYLDNKGLRMQVLKTVKTSKKDEEKSSENSEPEPEVDLSLQAAKDRWAKRKAAQAHPDSKPGKRAKPPN